MPSMPADTYTGLTGGLTRMDPSGPFVAMRKDNLQKLSQELVDQHDDFGDVRGVTDQ